MKWQDKVLDQPSWHFNSGSPGTIFEQISLNVLVFPLLTLNKQGNRFYKVGGERGWEGVKSLWWWGRGIEGGDSKVSMCVWTLFYLPTLVRMKRLLQRKYLFWPILLTSQYFCMFFKFHNFANFYVFRKLHAIQNQNMVPDFSVYFDVKSFSFAKINPHEISKPMYLRKLIQAKILRRWWSEKVSLQWSVLLLLSMFSSEKCFTVLNRRHLARKRTQTIILSIDVS